MSFPLNQKPRRFGLLRDLGKIGTVVAVIVILIGVLSLYAFFTGGGIFPDELHR